MKQSRPPVTLRGGGDGLVLCGELRDGSPSFLLGHEIFVSREFGFNVLQHPTKNAPSRCSGVIDSVWSAVQRVWCINRHIRLVRYASKSHLNIVVFAGHRRIDEHMRSIGCDALGTV